MEDKKKNYTSLSMPYNAEISVAEAMMDNLGREHQINVSDLFKKTMASNKPEKSNSLALCKFLGLVETEGDTLKLSKLGFKYVNTAAKKDLLAHNLPEKYLTILGWIKSNNGTMTLDDVKGAIIDNWGNPPKEVVFQRMLRTFANFCNYIGVIKYIKGTAGRVELTQMGFSVLSTPLDKGSDLQSSKENTISPVTHNNVSSHVINQPDLSGDFPVIIMTKGMKPLDWDIQHREDWEHVDSYIKSLKNRWEKTHQDNGAAKDGE